MTRCEKCGGCIHVSPPMWSDPEEPYCLNCGKRVIVDIAPPIDNSNRTWDSVLCDRCHQRNSIRGKEMCWKCWDDHRGKQGAARHAAKMAAGQAARKLREQEAG